VAKNLYSLTLGFSFDRDLDRVKFPDSLRDIIFGLSFDRQIINVKWPTELRTLYFGVYFNQLLSPAFPSKFRDITFGNKFNKNIDIKWPRSLNVITFGAEFCHDITNVIFYELHIVYDYSTNITINSCKFPRSLYKIIHIIYNASTSRDEHVINYIRPTGQFTKQARSS
jgi:hypothetical protein